MKKIPLTLLIITIILSFTFNYENFLKSFDFKSNFYDVLYGIFFIFLIFWLYYKSEYFLSKKKKNSYFLTSFLFTFIGTIIFSFFGFLYILFFGSCSGVCGLGLIGIPPFIFIIIFFYSLIRIYIYNYFFKTNPFYFYLSVLVESTNLKNKIFSFIFFILSILILLLIGLDYKSHGAMFNLSNQSNFKYWSDKSINDNDITLCKYENNNYYIGCEGNFIKNSKNTKIIKKAKKLYNYFYNEQCGKYIDKYKKGNCRNKILSNIDNVIVSEVKEKLGKLDPRVRLYSNDWEKQLIIQFREKSQYTSKIKDFINKKNKLKNKIKDLSIFKLKKNYKSGITISVNLEEFIKEKTDFFEIFKKEIYPIFFDNNINKNIKNNLNSNNIIDNIEENNSVISVLDKTIIVKMNLIRLKIKNNSKKNQILRTKFTYLGNIGRCDLSTYKYEKKYISLINKSDKISLKPNQNIELIYKCTDELKYNKYYYTILEFYWFDSKKMMDIVNRTKIEFKSNK